MDWIPPDLLDADAETPTVLAGAFGASGIQSRTARSVGNKRSS